MTDAYQNRIAALCPGFDVTRFSPFLPRLQLDFLAFMNDINGGGAEDFLLWARSTLSWMP
jgi:hypothetical protein